MKAYTERVLYIKGKVGLVNMCTAHITKSLCGYAMHTGSFDSLDQDAQDGLVKLLSTCFLSQ